MLAKRAEMVKYLVSIGNLCWMVNGIMTRNLPLIVSNGFCLVVMAWEIAKPRKRSKRGLDVRLLRKWRKEAERKIIVQQFENGFRVVELVRGKEQVIPSRICLDIFYQLKPAIEHCEHHRRMYILSKIKRRVY